MPKPQQIAQHNCCLHTQISNTVTVWQLCCFATTLGGTKTLLMSSLAFIYSGLTC